MAQHKIKKNVYVEEIRSVDKYAVMWSTDLILLIYVISMFAN
jgi:hypothetical protein